MCVCVCVCVCLCVVCMCVVHVHVCTVVVHGCGCAWLWVVHGCVCVCVCSAIIDALLLICIVPIFHTARILSPPLQELTADKSRLDEVNGVALQLIGEGHSGEHIIREHQASLNTRSPTTTYIVAGHFVKY